jgi:hypothetical protein
MTGRDELASLSLFPATRAQVLESRTRTYNQWGRGLSIQQYLGRDELMDTLEHARDGKLITWYVIDEPINEQLGCFTSVICS